MKKEAGNLLYVDSVNDAYKMITFKVAGWLDSLILMIPNLITATIVFLFFYMLGRAFKGLTRSLLRKTTATEKFISVIGRIMSTLFILLGIFFCLGILKLDKTVTSLLAGAGIIGLALSFAFQDIATNLISGFFIAVKKPLKVGDLVETNGFYGHVMEIDLRAIHLKTFQGQNVIIPSKDVLQKPIKNFVTYGERRLDLEVGVSYGDDLEIAAATFKRALESIGERDLTRDVDVFCDRFGDSSIVLVGRVWINLYQNMNFMKAKHEAIIAIHNSFKKNNITIPFPIRTLDFGIKGGQTLEAVLKKDTKALN
ncbi:MAG: mechanosensitive ion channel family protein [Cytophagaceae bacterium]